MRLHKRTLSVLVAIALVGGVTVVATAPAYAASCDRYSCHGWDPNSRNCWWSSQKTQTAWSGNYNVTVWNRYSDGCHANWAVGQLNAAALAAGYGLAVFIDTTDSKGTYEYMCVPNSAPSSGSGNLTEYCSIPPPSFSSQPIYTDMVDGTNVTRARALMMDRNGNVITYTDLIQQ
jgi:hypothetical protein